MMTMHGLFDLKLDKSQIYFKQAFDEICDHLQEQGLVKSWRFMIRKPHDGFDARAPKIKYHVSMDFENEADCQNC